MGKKHKRSQQSLASMANEKWRKHYQKRSAKRDRTRKALSLRWKHVSVDCPSDSSETACVTNASQSGTASHSSSDTIYVDSRSTKRKASEVDPRYLPRNVDRRDKRHKSASALAATRKTEINHLKKQLSDCQQQLKETQFMNSVYEAVIDQDCSSPSAVSATSCSPTSTPAATPSKSALCALLLVQPLLLLHSLFRPLALLTILSRLQILLLLSLLPLPLHLLLPPLLLLQTRPVIPLTSSLSGTGQDTAPSIGELFKSWRLWVCLPSKCLVSLRSLRRDCLA